VVQSELVTKAFGQGITVNLVQMAVAYSALANGGLLMKPYLVDAEILPDGRKITTEPETVRRVISKEASAQITSILIASVQRGYAKRVDLPGYSSPAKREPVRLILAPAKHCLGLVPRLPVSAAMLQQRIRNLL